jgi:demethylmenaquinone methyltransferase/2-methoxy-6-polyprenyl-1,4-benzoquinol methylase
VEFACGTGLWTEHLLQRADRVTALDISPESLELNRARVGTSKVTHVCTDLFDWEPPREFDGAFFGFWLSHIPPDRFEQFWKQVRDALKKNGRVFFVDSRYAPKSTAKDHGLEGPGSIAVTRRLNDGRAFRIIKIFYEPEALRARLAKLGWTVEVHETREFFIYGFGEPS